ncbi:unnamed protein product [Urochloa decumbens]|uniref:Uncharacterized protein n=1 Tax=Urochloa decumbens TaxID=240449 RepID=A0ABC9BG47_9POAL
MLRRARVPVPAPAAEAARPRRGQLQKAKEAPAPAAPRALSRAAVDAVLYTFVAALWANDFVGTVLEILGRWVFGKGSSMEAAGLAVRECSKFVMVLLSPSYIPLILMRAREHAQFDLKEQEKERKAKEEREKLTSNHIVTVETVKEQLPKKNAAPRPRLPKGVKMAPLYWFLPMMFLQFLAIMMQSYLGWRVACVLFDAARLGIAVIIGVWAARNLVILVKVPKVQDEDDETQ